MTNGIDLRIFPHMYIISVDHCRLSSENSVNSVNCESSESSLCGSATFICEDIFVIEIVNN